LNEGFTRSHPNQVFVLPERLYGLRCDDRRIRLMWRRSQGAASENGVECQETASISMFFASAIRMPT
jgi:hypothetical protein